MRRRPAPDHSAPLPKCMSQRLPINARYAVLLFWCLMAACHATVDSETTRMTCTFSDWSAPAPMGNDSVARSALARQPRLATTRAGQTYIVGNDIASFMEPVREGAVSVWRLGRESLGRPSGQFDFILPHAFIDGRERIHLVWAERQDPQARRAAGLWLSKASSEIWAAVYDPTSGWSRPRLLLKQPNLLWKTMIGGDQAPPMSDGAVLALPVVPNAVQGDQVVLVRFVDNELVATTTAGPPDLLYASGATLGGRAYLGTIATPAKDGDAPAGTTVFLQISDDAGATWQDPLLVSRSPHPTHWVKTRIAPDGTIHFVWVEQREGGRRTVRHSASADLGRSWSKGEDLVNAASPAGLHAIIDRCGTLHVLLEHVDAAQNQGRVSYAEWRGAWTAPVSLFDSLHVTGPMLHHTSDGRIVLAFAARSAGANDSVPQVTMYSERTHREPAAGTRSPSR